MIKIVPYEKVHIDGIDALWNEIAIEFDEEILAKPSNETPTVPVNYWVAFDGSTLIGTVGVIFVQGHFGILKRMMLKKEYRGKAEGVSQLLLQTVFDLCKEREIEKLYLGTMNQFKAAQAFYQKHGFQRVSENELPIGFLKNPLDTVFFVKEINHNLGK